jgi:hypothetical protein
MKGKNHIIFPILGHLQKCELCKLYEDIFIPKNKCCICTYYVCTSCLVKFPDIYTKIYGFFENNYCQNCKILLV